MHSWLPLLKAVLWFWVTLKFKIIPKSKRFFILCFWRTVRVLVFFGFFCSFYLVRDVGLTFWAPTWRCTLFLDQLLNPAFSRNLLVHPTTNLNRYFDWTYTALHWNWCAKNGCHLANCETSFRSSNSDFVALQSILRCTKALQAT